MHKLYETKNLRLKKVRGWKNKQRGAVRLSPADNLSPPPPSVIVRPMVLEDILELAELYRQFFNQSSHVPKMTEILERLLTRDDYIFLSAACGDKLVGTVMGIVCEHLYGNCAPFLVLQNFIVDQEHHRKGVGSLLLAEMESRAKEKGCLCCDLVSTTYRVGACRFYRDRGFDGIYEGTVGFRKLLR